MRRLSLLLILSACVAIGCSSRSPVPSAEQVVIIDPSDSMDVSKDATDSDGFPFPDDRGGTLVRATVTPTERMPPLTRARAPKHRPVPASLESPPLPMTPVVAEVPRVPMQIRRDVLRPRLVTEETTVRSLEDPVLPQMVIFFVGEKTKEASVDVNLPPSLPILAQPLPDRASLADATLDASAEAAVAAAIPRRTMPAPFLKMDVPDPYENRRPVHLPVPDEPDTPASGSPATPKP
jgi:hypothetical protein